MNKLVLLTILIVAAASLQAADTGLEALKETYARETRKLDAQYEASAAKIVQSYGRALAALRKASSKSGDLEAVLALDKEIERFGTDQSLPTSAPRGFPDEGAVVLGRASAALQAAAVQKDKGVEELSAKYAARLKALQKQLVAADKLDEAVAVKAETERVDFVIADAQSRLGRPGTAFPSSTDQPGTEEPEFGRSLTLHYSFSKSEGDKVSDSSGAGNNGTAHGAKWTRMGRVGGGCRFDGKDDWIQTDRPGLPTDGSDWSIGLWLRPKRGGATACVLSQYAKGHGRLNVKLEADGQCRFFYGRGAAVTGGCGSLKEAEWSHLALVNENGTVRSFLNGRHVCDLPGRVAAVMSRRTVLGAERSHAWYYSGYMDEVMIWNRALSESEVKQVYELTGGK